MAMRIAELMTPKVITVAPDDPLSTAQQIFRANNIHHLLAVEKGRVVGVLSLREVLTQPPEATVASVMSKDVVVVEPDASTRDVAQAIIGRSHGCVAVVDGGRIAGIVTTTDLLRVLSRGAVTARAAG